ncbi:hypothetical protein HG530_009609 [Fusarium avenaceum]|nr:hypothetical protein HG530_009609 [Fusarium avenaceum]
MDHLSGPVLLSGFLMSSIVYWHVFLVIDYLLRRLAPTVYERLKLQDQLRKLNPLILTIVRMSIGLTISLPSCVQAARTTPWGVDQPLNTAGQICVVSQLAVWSNELPLVRMYSLELFIHHILCLFAAANIILSPPIHQIKPLYIYYASMMGDVGPGSVMILRMAGHSVKTSRLMYCVSLGSTLILIFCRIGGAFYTLTHVLTDPYNPTDWVWVIGVLLFGFYSLHTASCHLRRLGIIKLDSDRYRITCFSRFTIPMSHLFLALACSASLLSTLFLYGLYLDQPLSHAEIHSLSLHSLIAVAVGLTGAVIARLAYPYNVIWSNPWGRFYLPLGMILTSVWISAMTNYIGGVARTTYLTSIGVTVPLFCAIARLAQYFSAKDAIVAREKPHADGNWARRHREMARENAVIFFVSLALLTVKALDLPEAARLAVAACLVVQFRYRWNFVPLAAANLHGVAGIIVATIISVLEPGFIIFAAAARYIRDEASFAHVGLNYALLGGTVLAAVSISGGKTKPIPYEAVSKPCEARRSHPLIILFLFICILQAIMARRYIMFEKGSTKTCLGFENFRFVLSSPFTWVGLLHMASLPLVVLRGAE